MRTYRLLFGGLRLQAAAGIVFMVCLAGVNYLSAQSFSSLYSFCSQTHCPDGQGPNGWLVQGPDGSFYGTAAVGGANGYGTAFKITSGGAFTTLHSFNGTDGEGPSALILATDGNFYGTTSQGGGTSCSRGSNLCGTVFRMTPAGAVTTLYTFCSRPSCADGYSPMAALVQGRDGNLYGTTLHGGAAPQCGNFGCGTIFKITLSGNLTTLYTFCNQGNCPFLSPQGSDPNAALVQGADGSFYGTTETGGSDNGCTFGCGTVFRLTPGGVLTSLHAFVNSVDGSQPGQMVQGLDGNFYGVTSATLFRISPGGSFTTLHLFMISDGFTPVGVMQATDGNLYGTTSQGGNNNCVFGCGTIFKSDLSGRITTLHAFTGVDGATPMGGLVQGTDGNFYGTTADGGSSRNCQNGCGTVFKLGVGLGPFVEVQPAFGNPGTQVRILGTNLTGATGVSFNGVPAVFTVVSSSEITASVPGNATTGTVHVTLPSGGLNSNADFQVTGPLQFVTVTPCRVADTRPGGPIQGGTQRNFTIAQAANCGIPASAAAYSLNVTAVPRGPLGYLTIWAQDEVQPYVSTMNSPDGRAKANAAIVPAGNNGVSVYVTNTSDVILDIDGYFAPANPESLQFYPMAPCRVVDTRAGANEPPGLGPPFLDNMETRDLPIPSSPCLQNLPNQPAAYSFNVTVSPYPVGQPENFLTVWPSDQLMPGVSTLNNYTATVVANAAIVPAAVNGHISAFAYNSTDLIIDINGYFAAPGQNGYSFYPAAPCRAYDSRNNNGPPFQGKRTVNIVTSPCTLPPGAKAYVFNATVVPNGVMPYLTLWPDGEQQPGVSTLNAYDGVVTSNMAIVPNLNGSIDAYAAALTQLILDISGYFAP